LTVDVAPSSALHADAFAVKSEMAPLRAPWACSCRHWLLARAPTAASARVSDVRYTSMGPDPRHTLRPAGTSLGWRVATVAVTCGVGLALDIGVAVSTAWGAVWQAADAAVRRMVSMSRPTERAVY
jgi:hypothetical protein